MQAVNRINKAFMDSNIRKIALPGARFFGAACLWPMSAQWDSHPTPGRPGLLGLATGNFISFVHYEPLSLRNRPPQCRHSH